MTIIFVARQYFNCNVPELMAVWVHLYLPQKHRCSSVEIPIRSSCWCSSLCWSGTWCSAELCWSCATTAEKKAKKKSYRFEVINTGREEHVVCTTVKVTVGQLAIKQSELNALIWKKTLYGRQLKTPGGKKDTNYFFHFTAHVYCLKGPPHVMEVKQTTSITGHWAMVWGHTDKEVHF